MPRISKFVHLKPTVERMYLSGKAPWEVSKLFPEIPQETLRDWHRYLKDKNLIPEPKEVPELPPIDSEALDRILNPVPKLTVIQGGSLEDDLNDLEWAKSQLKAIYHSTHSEGVRLQSIKLFVDAVKVEATVKISPKSTPEETEITKDYSAMSSEELSQLYREMLN